MASDPTQEDWQPVLVPYVVLIRAFAQGRITAGEFERLYLAIFKNDPTTWSKPFLEVLDALFGDVDEYCGDPLLRAEAGGLDDDELRASAGRALDRLIALCEIGEISRRNASTSCESE